MVKVFQFLKEDAEYYFDELAAKRVIDFIERFCRLYPEGSKWKLLDWQRQIVYDVFGWKRRDNQERRFVSVYIEVPRKNGKTFFAAALLLYLLMGEGRGAEVYASACTREQSGLLFTSIRRMIDAEANDPDAPQFFNERLAVTPSKNRIDYARGDSFLKALSGESVGSHGKHASAIVCDELHEWTTSNAEALYEALTTSFGNRKNPLVIHITTAGFGSTPTLAHRLHDKAKLFESGECLDPTFYGVVYGASQEDDWESEDVWKKANPSWELAERNLKRKYPAAKKDASDQNSFRRLFLNQWTQQQTRWLDITKFDAVSRPLNLKDFNKRDCVLGLDLSQIYDLSATSLIFPDESGKWSYFVRCYMPELQATRRKEEDGIDYPKWSNPVTNEGHLLLTSGISGGQTIDYDFIVQDIEALIKEHALNVVCVGYDPGPGASVVIPKLEAMGLTCLPIYQSFNEMNPASREFERRLNSKGEIEIQTNACLRWQAGNVEVLYDQTGTKIRPTKPRATGAYGGQAKNKVDGIVASIIATQTCLLTYNQRATAKEEYLKPGVYFV